MRLSRSQRRALVSSYDELLERLKWTPRGHPIALAQATNDYAALGLKFSRGLTRHRRKWPA
jgi:hypothetical protein